MENLKERFINNFSDKLIYIFIGSIYFMYGFEFTTLQLPEILHDLLLLLSLVALALYCFKNIKNYNNLSLRIVFLIFTILYYIKTKETVFSLVLITIALCNINNFNLIFKYIFIIRFFVLLFNILLVVTDIIPQSIIYAERGTRYALCYQHPNNLANELFFLQTLFYISFNNMNKKNKNIIYLIVSCLSFFITETRTILILNIMFLILMNFRHLLKKTIYKISPFIPLLCMSISIGSSYLLHIFRDGTLVYSVITFFDKFLSNRFLLGSFCFDDLSISLLGGNLNRDILAANHLYSVIDNAYVNLLFNFGILSCILFLIIYWFTIKKFISYDKYKYIVIIMMFLFLGISENILRTLAINYTFLLCTILFDYKFHFKTRRLDYDS